MICHAPEARPLTTGRMKMRIAMLLCVLLVTSGCGRPPADVSALAYRVVDEGRAQGDCMACVVASKEATCRGGGQAADVAWHLPSGAQAAADRIEVEREDGSRVLLAQGGVRGRAAVPVALRPEERIRLIAADSGKTLAFTRVDVPMGCLLADPAAGR